MKKKEKEKKNKCYIVLCHWRDENDEEVNIINNVTYPTIEEALKIMNDSIEDDIENNSVHNKISKDSTGYVINKTDYCYEVFEEWNSDNWYICWRIIELN